MNEDLWERAQTFCGVMVIVYSVEFGYIYLQLIIRKLSVDNIAGG